MPTVGLEYRYPFISVQSWGTQTIEPIAQVIVAAERDRSIGKLPERRRAEPDLRRHQPVQDRQVLRLGPRRRRRPRQRRRPVHRAVQPRRLVNTLFGQSYQLFGANSFAIGDITNTGLDSGLDTTRSDYVARVSYQPNRIYTFTSRFRFDQDDFDAAPRSRPKARANFDRWSVSVLYGDYAAQPELGFLTRREGILASASVKLTQNWLATARGALRHRRPFSSTRPRSARLYRRLPHLALNYITNYTYSGNVTTDQRSCCS